MLDRGVVVDAAQYADGCQLRQTEADHPLRCDSRPHMQ